MIPNGRFNKDDSGRANSLNSFFASKVKKKVETEIIINRVETKEVELSPEEKARKERFSGGRTQSTSMREIKQRYLRNLDNEQKELSVQATTNNVTSSAKTPDRLKIIEEKIKLTEEAIKTNEEYIAKYKALEADKKKLEEEFIQKKQAIKMKTEKLERGVEEFECGKKEPKSKIKDPMPKENMMKIGANGGKVKSGNNTVNQPKKAVDSIESMNEKLHCIIKENFPNIENFNLAKIAKIKIIVKENIDDVIKVVKADNQLSILSKTSKTEKLELHRANILNKLSDSENLSKEDLDRIFLAPTEVIPQKRNVPK